MSLTYAECTCPKCGAKYKESCNTWMYGSPIRICRNCNEEYIDNRWREVAVEGFDPRSGNADFYLKGTLGLIAFTLICAALLFWMINSSGHFPVKMAACVIGGILGSLFCGYRLFRIKSGSEAKDNAIYMEESKKRMQNKEYVKKLEEYGYNIPDEFKNQ